MVESPYTSRPDARRWGFIRALPSNILALVLKSYRAVVSPLYGPVCRFFPSCSAYALEAVYVHGAFRGTIMSTRRLVRCHPWQSGGVDPVPPGKRIWPKGQVPRIIELNHPPIPPDPLDESRRG